MKYIHLDGSIYYRHMSGRLLTPDDVTQPRIRECLERLLSLTVSTLREQNLLSDLPQDFEIIAERMDPEVPEVFYFVSQSLRRVINYGYACLCGPIPANSHHPREQCPNPRLRTSSPPPPPKTHTLPTPCILLPSSHSDINSLQNWKRHRRRASGRI